MPRSAMVWSVASADLPRDAVGLIEILTWPFPIWHGGYYPILPPEIPYIHAGYSEFPPEIGNQSKYPYVRDYDQDPY
jgi:hypothetical protein